MWEVILVVLGIVLLIVLFLMLLIRLVFYTATKAIEDAKKSIKKKW